ncbi:MAG: hypothetical protein HDQ97_19225 [Lachnospiraceae bacterium]|nr:hypothetical protein [Lachnospiraceae bacterium]
MTVKEEKTLLKDMKNYLDITWKDPEGDKKIAGMIKRGMAAISGKIGECNFLEETQERALLFDYVMYARAGETPQFWTNYKEEIVSLQISRKVDDYAKS